jgi:hypothetical protein
MLEAFVEKVARSMERQGYTIGNPAYVPGVSALLYTFFPRRVQLGFAKVENHFLFVDWRNTAFGRLDRLIEIANQFSVQVNQRFPVPHALRLQIPNLAVAALSPDPFPQNAAQFVLSKNLTPWYGGETAQLLLVSIGSRQIISQVSTSPRRYPIPGALPLHHAAAIIREACQSSFA